MHSISLSQELGTELERVPVDVFSSLRRSDQRLKAEQYVAGLLAARGRKTLRNVADQLGGRDADMQSVHHFISGSSWDWMPVRRGLAQHAQELLGASAWVVRSTVVPKEGGHSVGVSECYDPRSGRTVNAQQSLGIWMASGDASVPVDWDLVLPTDWLDNDQRRLKASIPSASRPQSREESARDLVLRADHSRRPDRRPVVLDVEGLDPARSALLFGTAQVPLIQRVGAGTRLAVDASVLRGYSGEFVSAHRLVQSLRRLWRPRGHGVLSLAVPVVLPLPSARGRSLLLVAEWPASDPASARLWLVSGRAAAADVLRLTRLTRVVDHDDALVAERVGLRDFVGRSFQGWHRHMTLASVAHFAAVRAGLEETRARPLSLR